MDSAEVARMSRFLLDLYRDAQALSPDVFQKQMLQQLGHFLPYDYAAWGGADSEARQISELVVLNQSENLLVEWQKLGHEDAFCDLTLQRLNQTCLFDDVGNYRNSLVYKEHWRSFDVRHMMSTIVSEPIDGYVSFIGLCNEDAVRPFTEEQRALKQLLMPHLSEALRLNRHSALDIPGGDEEGSALINRCGWVLASREPFSALLREEWGNRRENRLPETFMTEAPVAGEWCGRHIALTCRRFNDYYLLRARPLTALDRLPPRAQEVAELYAAGFTNKEVARRLGISPETVRKHLARIYNQLGIRSKASLAGMLSRAANSA